MSKRKSEPLNSQRAVAARIAALRETLGLSQLAFGERLKVNLMTISRWERAFTVPQSHHYIELGNLAGSPECWYFWGLAGLKRRHVFKAARAVANLEHLEECPAKHGVLGHGDCICAVVSVKELKKIAGSVDTKWVGARAVLASLTQVLRDLGLDQP